MKHRQTCSLSETSESFRLHAKGCCVWNSGMTFATIGRHAMEECGNHRGYFNSDIRLRMRDSTRRPFYFRKKVVEAVTGLSINSMGVKIQCGFVLVC